MGFDSAVPDPTVVLVHPVSGGSAIAFADQQIVVFEAVLANSQRELPEILRLGWALAQLMVQPGDEALIPLATIPACLAAGALFDVCPFDRRILKLATETWLACEPAPASADVIWRWWQETAAQPDWSKRIADLNLRIQ